VKPSRGVKDVWDKKKVISIYQGACTHRVTTMTNFQSFLFCHSMYVRNRNKCEVNFEIKQLMR
jgi:hypothetical protein